MTTGCCSGCQGTGVSDDPQTGGLCWDCRGTGCAHPEPLCRDDDEGVPFGMHETNLAPWERPHALDATTEED